MARLSVFWTETAAKQRNSTLKYWNKKNQSTQYSKKLRDQISTRTNQLSEFPKIGKKVDFRNTRVISIGHFSLFYKHSTSKLIIIAFWDNRNDPEKLLKNLKSS